MPCPTSREILLQGDLDPAIFGCSANLVSLQDFILSYDAAGSPTSLTLEMPDGRVSTVDLQALVQAAETTTTLTYDAATRTLTYANEDGVVTNLSLDVETFIQNVNYDAASKELTFTYNGPSGLTDLVVPIADLVDVYALQVTDTSSVDLTLAGDGSVATPWDISAAVSLDPAADNLIADNGNGLLLNHEALCDWFAAEITAKPFVCSLPAI